MKPLNINRFHSVSGLSDSNMETKWDSDTIDRFIRSHVRTAYFRRGINIGKLRFFMENAMNGYISKTDLEDHLLAAGYHCIKDSKDIAYRVYDIRLIGIYRLDEKDEIPEDGAIFIDPRGHMVQRFQSGEDAPEVNSQQTTDNRQSNLI